MSARAIRAAAVGIFLLPAACASAPGGSASENMFSESEAYERFMGRWSRRLASAFLELAGPQDGESVLDVGSGTGALAEEVLSRAESCLVVGIDPAPSYVEYARDRLGDERARFEVGDAQAMRFENDSFDRTLSLLVVNFIPDAPQALREMVRVTRPGGVVAAAVWDYDEGMEMLRVFWDEVVALDPSAEQRDERHMPYCRPGQLAELWRECGLADVREVALVIPTAFATFEDFWSPFLERQGPAGAYVAALSERDRLRLEQRLRRRLEADAREGRIELTARAWAVRGTVPRR